MSRVRLDQEVTVDLSRGRSVTGTAAARRRVMGVVHWDVIVDRGGYEEVVRAPERLVRPLGQESLPL